MQANVSHQASDHSIVLVGRTNATITGVEDVDCFNEQIVVLRTPLGALTLTGESLNISKLNLDEGKLVVDGDFSSIEYSGRKKTAGSGFFGRLFG